MLGLKLIPWQRWLLIHALELRPDGRFRFRTVLVMVARQNGKTTLVEIKNLWKMFVLQVALVIGTAQNLDTAEESWDKAVEIVESIPELKVELKHVDKTNGKKALKLTNGSRWKIAAASRRGGRGLSGDDVNLDELREHLDWLSWGAVTKTTMARPNAQIWAYSNAGDDRSVVLNKLQLNARVTVDNPASDPTLGIFEWSVPDDVRCTCEPAAGDPHAANCRLRDPDLWAMANPSLGYTITHEAMSSALTTDPEAIFITECLCRRVPDLGGKVIDPAKWAGLADVDSRRSGDVAVGVDVDVAQDRSYAAISIYGLREDGLGHGQLLDYLVGVDRLIPRLVEIRAALSPVCFAMGRGTYASLKTDLEKSGFTVSEDLDEPERGDLAVLNSTDMGAATAMMIDGVRQGSFRYVPAAQYDVAVAGAKTRQTGDALAWSRLDPNSEIGALVSLTVAKWGYASRAHLVVRTYDAAAAAANVF